MEIKLGKKKYKSLNVTLNLYKEYKELSAKYSEISLAEIDNKGMEDICKFIIKLYGNKFTLEDMYEELEINEILAQLVCLQTEQAAKMSDRIGELTMGFIKDRDQN